MNDLDTRLRHMAREEETPVPKDFPHGSGAGSPGRYCWQPAWC